MSVSVSIIPPPGFPDPREPIISFSLNTGNIMTAPVVLGYIWTLDEATPVQARKALQEIIAELDKGDAGEFSDAWWVRADLRWSNGREMQEYWERVGKYRTLLDGEGPDAQWGKMRREELRKDALRFFLYYAAGYEVRWSP